MVVARYAESSSACSALLTCVPTDAPVCTVLAGLAAALGQIAALPLVLPQLFQQLSMQPAVGTAMQSLALANLIQVPSPATGLDGTWGNPYITAPTRGTLLSPANPLGPPQGPVGAESSAAAARRQQQQQQQQQQQAGHPQPGPEQPAQPGPQQPQPGPQQPPQQPQQPPPPAPAPQPGQQPQVVRNPQYKAALDPNATPDYHDIGQRTMSCVACGAKLWPQEVKRDGTGGMLCCMHGKANNIRTLFPHPAPQPLRRLLTADPSTDQEARQFQSNVRKYNMLLQMASSGIKVTNPQHGVSMLAVTGGIYHMLPSLQPNPLEPAKFAQMYIIDNEDMQVARRLQALNLQPGSNSSGVNDQTLRSLLL